MKLFLSLSLLPCHVNQSVPLTDISSSPIFHGCVNERLADRTPSPTFSTADSDITELADEQQDEMEDFDDEAFVDDTGSDAGTEEGSDLFNDGHDPFYDRSPWFILVGRLVRLTLRMTHRDQLLLCAAKTLLSGSGRALQAKPWVLSDLRAGHLLMVGRTEI